MMIPCMYSMHRIAGCMNAQLIFMVYIFLIFSHCRLNNADKKKNNLFAWKGKNERDKKKLLDTVLKQLRGLVNGTAPHS